MYKSVQDRINNIKKVNVNLLDLGDIVKPISNFNDIVMHLFYLRPVHTWTTRHDMTACDTTRFFAPHTIKWISSHISSTTKSGLHDKKLLQQKSLWKRFLSCVAATVSRKLLQKTVSIGISSGFINV